MAETYRTIVFRVADGADTSILSPFISGLGKPEIAPGIVVTGAALHDVMTEAQIYEDAIEKIAGGNYDHAEFEDAQSVALDALDRAERIMNGESYEAVMAKGAADG